MALYAFNRREDGNLTQAETELMFSIGKTYDLYHYLLLLVLEVADIAGEKIDQALQKKMPTPEDLNPQRRFIDNQVIAQLRKNLAFKKYISYKKLSWVNYSHIPRLLYNKMIAWEAYEEYMKSESHNYLSDKKFIIKLVTNLFSGSEDLQSNLEEQSIFWNDDMEYISAMVEKTLKKFKPDSGENTPLMPLYKNEEDEEFVKKLAKDVGCHYSKANIRTYNLNKHSSDVQSEMGVFAWVHKEEKDYFWVATRKIWVEQARAKALSGRIKSRTNCFSRDTQHAEDSVCFNMKDDYQKTVRALSMINKMR